MPTWYPTAIIRLIEMGRPKWTERCAYAESMAQKALMQGTEVSSNGSE